jgi:hypothetical protein
MKEAEYTKHKKELDDMEYNYLGGQRTGLEAEIKEAQDEVKKELPEQAKQFVFIDQEVKRILADAHKK